MLEYFLTILILLGAYTIVRCVILPKRERNQYAKLFRKHGYRVIELPYQPFGAPYYDKVLKAEKKKEDPLHHHKHVYPGSDILIGNILTRPQIVIMNP